MTANPHYCVQRYLLMTLDPVHIGTGGYRLGRVDNSIAREPGTRLPKIPGSSLHGAARTYAAYAYGDLDAAGQKQKEIGNPQDHPIYYTFGYNFNTTDRMASGVVSIFDARLLLFPVHSAVGPVWVTTAARLQEAGFKPVHGPDKAEEIILTWEHQGRLNLGWLLLDIAANDAHVQPPAQWEQESAWKAVKKRIALVHDSLFSTIVNSNLEVRTSVAINPETGAAEDGALYTYEAIPRAAFLTSEVMLDDYKHKDDKRPYPFPVKQTADKKPLPQGRTWQTPLDVVRIGLDMVAYLGVGGMGTRGFGRIQVVGNPVEENPFAASKQEGTL